MKKGKTFTVKDARIHFGEILSRAHYGDEVASITKNGRPFACIAPIKDLSGLKMVLAIRGPSNEEERDLRELLASAIRVDANLEPHFADAHYAGVTFIHLVDAMPDERDAVTSFLSSIGLDRHTLPPLRPDDAKKLAAARESRARPVNDRA